ncbi:MAG: transporter [Prevotella sp.]|nr:transporter [Prevotella sp.]
MIALIPVCLMAQEETADFTSDLFGSVTTVDILPKGRLQWETYVAYEHSSMYGLKSDTWTVNYSVLRYGISNAVELCMQGSWLYSTIDHEHESGFSNLAVGFKTRLFEGWKAAPAISLRGWLFVPGGKNADFLPEHFGCQWDLIFYNRLASWCDVSYTGTMIWDDNSRPTTFWGANFNFLLSDRLTFSVEQSNYYYGDDAEDRWQPWTSVCLSYQVHPRVELGVTSDMSLKYPKRFWDLALGVAWQLTKK